MAKIYYDSDADLAAIQDKVIGVIGYGIQGRAQALNLRDSGLNVMVSEMKDTANYEQAKADGFKPVEAKVVELSKTVESLMSEVLYLKAELRKEIEKPEKVESRKYRSKTEEMSAEGEEIEEDQVEDELIEEEEEIIVCD